MISWKVVSIQILENTQKISGKVGGSFGFACSSYNTIKIIIIKCFDMVISETSIKILSAKVINHKNGCNFGEMIRLSGWAPKSGIDALPVKT